jgi:hypothetical protein
MTGIRQYAQALGAVAQNELHGLAGVMRYRKRFDQDIAQGERPVAINDFESGICLAGACNGLRSGGCQCSPREAIGAGPCATDVVGMLVGDQDGVDFIGLDTQARQSPLGFPGPKPGVDQDPGAANFDQ